MNYNQETVFTLWDNKVRVLAICARLLKSIVYFNEVLTISLKNTYRLKEQMRSSNITPTIHIVFKRVSFVFTILPTPLTDDCEQLFSICL